MAAITLHFVDPAQRLTLKTILAVTGHGIVDENAELQFSDMESRHALDFTQTPTVLAATTSEIPDAVKAMAQGAWGYIFIPFQPDEAALTVSRVLSGEAQVSAKATLPELPTLESVEFDHIRIALRLANGNQAKAARALNIGRNTLWRKLKKMDPKNSDG